MMALMLFNQQTVPRMTPWKKNRAKMLGSIMQMFGEETRYRATLGPYGGPPRGLGIDLRRGMTSGGVPNVLGIHL